MLGLLAQVDKGLANSVAEGLGMSVPAKLDKPMNMSIPADGDPRKFQPKRVPQAIDISPTLSQINNPNFPNDTIKTRKIAVLLADGFDDAAVDEMSKALLTAGAMPKTVAPHLGVVTGAGGTQLKVDFSFLTGSSVLFDAVYIPGRRCQRRCSQTTRRSTGVCHRGIQTLQDDCGQRRRSWISGQVTW